MATLTVSTPTLEFETAPGLAVLEKPVTVKVPTVTFPDGKAFNHSDLAIAGFFIYRQVTPAAVEIWDEASKAWKPDPGGAIASLQPKPLFKPDEFSPWQSLFVAAGQQNPPFEPNLGGFPRYFLRAYFVSNDRKGKISGLSAPSATLQFASILDTIRAGIVLGKDQKPENADEITLFLRNPSRQIIGSVEIKDVGGIARIEISNRNAGSFQQAVIRLLPTGDVEIQPAVGKEVRVLGLIKCDRILYQPADPSGNPIGSLKWLG